MITELTIIISLQNQDVCESMKYSLLFSSSSYLCIPSFLSINHSSKLCVYLYGFSLSISILEKFFVLETDHLFKLDLEKAEEPEIKLPTSVRSSKKREFQKNIYLCFIDYAKAFD